MPDTPEGSLRGVRPGDYVALFYDELSAASEAVEPYAVEGLRRGDYVILVASAEDIDAWVPLTQRLDDIVRAGEFPGRFVALFYPPSTADETRQLLADFLEELPRSFNSMAERHVRIVGDLQDRPTEPVTCAIRLACRECSSLCLFHVETLGQIQGGPLQRVSAGHSMTISLLPLASSRATRHAPRKEEREGGPSDAARGAGGT